MKRKLPLMTKEQWRKRKEQWEKFNAWERQEMRTLRLMPQEAFRIFEMLYQEARSFGAFERRLPGEDLEAQLRMARILNAGRDRR